MTHKKRLYLTIVLFLVSFGCLNVSSDIYSVNALTHWTLETVTAQLASGNINAIDKNGYTPLHWAAEKGDPYIITALLASGANVNAKNNTGNTPLHVAALSGKTANVETLINAGSDINTKNNVQNDSKDSKPVSKESEINQDTILPEDKKNI